MEEHRQRLDALPGSFVKLSEYPVKPDADESEKLIQFLCTVGKLKTIDRTGWILDPQRTVRKPESVAGKSNKFCDTLSMLTIFHFIVGHMYRMGVMSMMFENKTGDSANDPKLDILKIIQMSLVHDMAECITGDITPYDNLSETEKHRRESEAMKNLGMFFSGISVLFTKSIAFTSSCIASVVCFAKVFTALRRIRISRDC